MKISLDFNRDSSILPATGLLEYCPVMMWEITLSTVTLIQCLALECHQSRLVKTPVYPLCTPIPQFERFCVCGVYLK